MAGKKAGYVGLEKRPFRL